MLGQPTDDCGKRGFAGVECLYAEGVTGPSSSVNWRSQGTRHTTTSRLCILPFSPGYVFAPGRFKGSQANLLLIQTSCALRLPYDLGRSRPSSTAG